MITTIYLVSVFVGMFAAYMLGRAVGYERGTRFGVLNERNRQ